LGISIDEEEEESKSVEEKQKYILKIQSYFMMMCFIK